jgi:hypothetical protein
MIQIRYRNLIAEVIEAVLHLILATFTLLHVRALHVPYVTKRHFSTSIHGGSMNRGFMKSLWLGIA